MSEGIEPISPPLPKRDAPSRKRALWGAGLGLGMLVAGVVLVVSFVRPTRSTPPERDLAEEAREDLERRNYRPLSGPLEALLTAPGYKPVPTQAHALLGQPAPDFTLAAVDGESWSLSQALKEGPVVLVFYYGYHCDHCVSQLFGLHEDVEKFRELGAKVVAVSADAPELTRERFQKYGPFAFPVLSDPDNRVAAKYGTYALSKKAGEAGDLMHGTFVIDRRGRVVWTNRGDGPFVENRTLLMEVYRSEGRASKP